MMRSGQVQRLHREGMEIGAHTVRHPILATLSPEQAESEIDAGRKDLRRIVDAPVDVIAYPNGQPTRDFGPLHVAMVKRLGFRGAVTTAVGSARSGDDVFQLPRFTPWDVGAAAWSARLLLNRWQAVALAEQRSPVRMMPRPRPSNRAPHR